jgi:hypothetical protein
LESAVERLHLRHCGVILCGLQPQPASTLQRSELGKGQSSVVFCPDIEHGIAAAEEHLRSRGSLPPLAVHES